MKLAVVIPAKDEAETIGSVIKDIGLHIPEAMIIVVDDFSQDDTASIAESMGVVVLSHICSLGAWIATQTGMRYANATDIDLVITMDADGQHNASEISALIRGFNANNVVVGSCLSRGSQARKLAWAAFKRLTGIKVYDLTSGFRLYDRTAIEVLTSRQASLLEYQDMGVLLMLRSAGLNVNEVTVEMNRRQVGISHIFSSWRKVVYYMAVTLFLCLVKAIPEKPRRFTKRLKQGV